MTPPQARVFVVGSINRDLVFGVPRFPMPGETVLAQTVRPQAAHFGTTLVVTRGAYDIVVAEQASPPSFHPAIPAGRVVDTTGAGDAFVGAFAAALAHGYALTTAVRWGAAAGSITVEFAGARSGHLSIKTVTDRANRRDQT